MGDGTSGRSVGPFTIFPTTRGPVASAVCHDHHRDPHAVTVAAGVFAPGHLGELTRYLPFELVDDVLAQTRTVQRRLRALPSRIGVYFVLALGLFPRLGYARVWAKLIRRAGRPGGAGVSEKALRDLRRRLGPAPLKALFEVVAGPLAQPRTPGTCFAGLRTVAFDGLNSLKVPDTDRNRSWLGRIRYRMGFAGYPTLRLMSLAETGTRGLLGATHRRRRRPGRGHPGPAAAAAAAGRACWCCWTAASTPPPSWPRCTRTGAMLLARGRSQRVPPVLAHLPDGSYLSDLDGLAVRIIEADLTMTGADGSRVGDRYRLITTLLDHRPVTRPPRWSGSTTNAGRSSRPTWRCGTPCSTATSCAPGTGPASSRRSGRC